MADYSKLCITRSDPTLVRPCLPTPFHTLLLSPLDSLPVLRCNARTLHVFSQGPSDAPAAISLALSRALVPYYPLAGRLILHQPHRLQVDCSAQGVSFVVASSPSTLPSLHYFDDDVSSIPFHLLLPPPFSQTQTDDEPLVQMQVTQLACGGFVMGLVFCHSICDGLGAAQFLNAVAQLARGFERLSVTPAWHRDFFPSSTANATGTALPNHDVLPPVPDYRLEHSTIDISIEQIDQLKKEFHESTEKSCSTFEIVAAALWRSRTRAVYYSNFKDDEPQIKKEDGVKLVFFANCRQWVKPTPVPKGFYGNCFFPVTVESGSKRIAEGSMREVVELIQEAKSKVGSEFENYVKGEHNNGDGGKDPFAPPLKYTTLFISEWGRLGFNDIDYGWGRPVQVIPIQGSAIIPVGIVGCLPIPRKGVRLMTWCVEEGHRQSFLHHISKLLS